jgi:hypothetical protein
MFSQSDRSWYTVESLEATMMSETTLMLLDVAAALGLAGVVLFVLRGLLDAFGNRPSLRPGSLRSRQD